MNLMDAIGVLDNFSRDKRNGLPEALFLFLTRTTPMVNVDLLVQDEHKGTLLAWRDDEYCGTGWHIPGGIVRYKETLEERLQRTAERELGTKITFDKQPLAINETILEQENRGHFISFLYRCYVPQDYQIPRRENRLKWHGNCPENLIKVHGEIYSHLISGR